MDQTVSVVPTALVASVDRNVNVETAVNVAPIVNAQGADRIARVPSVDRNVNVETAVNVAPIVNARGVEKIARVPSVDRNVNAVRTANAATLASVAQTANVLNVDQNVNAVILVHVVPTVNAHAPSVDKNANAVVLVSVVPIASVLAAESVPVVTHALRPVSVSEASVAVEMLANVETLASVKHASVKEHF